MKISALVFDLDDTLVVDEAVSRAALQEVAACAAARYDVDSRMFVAAHERQRAAAWAEFPGRAFCEGIGISFEEALYGDLDGEGDEGFRVFREWSLALRTRHFERVLREAGADAVLDSGDLAAMFREVRRRSQRLMPDAKEILARLKAHARLGLLTNGAGCIQHEKIRDSGLAPVFDAILVSGEFGTGKPDPAPFLEICRRLDVPASETVMVGNSLARDVCGAKAAGLAAAVWLRVAGSEEHANVTPDATIDALHELPDVVARLAAD